MSRLTTAATPVTVRHAAQATDKIILQTNRGRLNYTIQGETSNVNPTGIMYVAEGRVATLTDYDYIVFAAQYFPAPTPVFSGEVHAIWDIAVGYFIVSERQ